MKALLFVLVMLVSSFSFAGEYGNTQSAQMVFEPTGTTCKQYYSLYPPGQVCRGGMLYIRKYDVQYEHNGTTRQQRTSTYPGQQIKVNPDGSMQSRIVTYERE